MSCKGRLRIPLITLTTPLRLRPANLGKGERQEKKIPYEALWHGERRFFG